MSKGMTITEFIDFYSEVYSSFGLFSEHILRSHADYLLGLADGMGGNEKLVQVAENITKFAHMVSQLKVKA